MVNMPVSRRRDHRIVTVLVAVNLLQPLLLIVNAKAIQKEFCADKESALYPDPEDCHFYYSCDHGITYQMSCPANLLFDPSISICNWPEEVYKQRKECQQPSNSNNKPTSASTKPSPSPTSTTKSPKNNTKASGINTKMPRSLEMRFTMGSKSVALYVTQKPGSSVDLNPKVLTAVRGRIVEWKSNETFAVYTDDNKSASIVASTNLKKGNSLTYRGSFKIDEKSYYLRPILAMNMYPASSKDMQVKYNGTQYTVTHEDDLLLTCPTATTAARGMTYDDASPTFVEAVQFDPASPASSGSKQHYGVELLLAIDYATYYKFYMLSTASTAAEKSTEAIHNIRYYFAHIVNGIDNRYGSINETDFDIYIRLVGYFIAQTPYDSPWTEKYGIKFDGMYTDAYKALAEFENWIQQHAATLPNFDAAMLYTSNLLFSGYRTDGTRIVISGLGEIAGACTSRKAAVSYEFGEYASIETGAHELGHVLGAQHDGLKNSCNSSSQYIMATNPGVLTNDTFNNAFKFSSCSVEYFRNYTSQLDRNNGNCMLNLASTVEPSDWNNFMLVYPGQKYKPDTQCQLSYGQNSYYCAGGSRDRSICREMKCWSPDDNVCYASIEQRAYDGTTCANGSWCFKGECVQNDMAPSAPLSCIYGDYRGTFSINNQQLTCSQIGSYQPYRCYDNGYSTDCCRTCSTIKDISKPGCEYGDREPDWCRSYLRPYDCYDPSVRSRCCSTCSRYYKNITGCEYGDRDNTWCPSVTSQQCYTSSTTCCSSCTRYYTGISGCEYGDKNTGCSIYVSYCQADANIANICCGTCNAAYPKTSTTTKSTTRTSTTTTTTTSTSTTPSTITTATTRTSTTPTTTQLPVSEPSNSTCPLGDGAQFCTTMPTCDCYVYSNLCCATCPKHYNASRKGCEYGDQTTWCSTYVQGPEECQRPEVKQYCCDTCEKYLTTSNCNGDRAPWCSSYVKGPEECARPEVQEYCCDTCQKMQSGVLEPICDDKADWCEGLHPSFCYDSSTENTCCLTCSSYKKNVATCRYGDMFTWCSPSYCDQNRKECCSTCS